MHATLPDIVTISLVLAGAGILTIASAILGRELWIAWRRYRDRVLRIIRFG